MKVSKDSERITYMILIAFCLTVDPLFFTWIAHLFSKFSYSIACVFGWLISSGFGVAAFLYFIDGNFHRNEDEKHHSVYGGGRGRY